MITGELKNKIDKLWLEFWQGGIANPLTVIEQITFLMFSRLLDINETRDEKRKARTGKSFYVWFYDLQDDGFSLDDKRDRLYDSDFAGDLPKVLEGWQQPYKLIAESDENDRTASAFWVSKVEIATNIYDLSINRYKEIVYEAEQHDPPKEILGWAFYRKHLSLMHQSQLRKISTWEFSEGCDYPFQIYRCNISSPRSWKALLKSQAKPTALNWRLMPCFRP